MSHVAIGIFDDYKRTGDAIIRLKDVGFGEVISLIGLDNEDPETIEKFTGDEEIKENFENMYAGGLMGAVAVHLDNIYEANINGVGHILLSGSIADALSASPYFKGEILGGLLEAFKDIGFDEDHAIRFSDIINDGRIIIFVISNPKSDPEIIDIYNEFGALETDSCTNNIIDNY